MTKTITVYRTWYAAWEEHQDELTKIREESEEIHPDDLEDAVTTMCDIGAIEASVYPFQPGAWWSAETYMHPYTGEREEATMHLDGFSDQEQWAIHDRLTARPV